ncbi:MAG: energy-coupling factor transporter transmembrane protein EcfT, partial [Coriobacteriia bacterium]|nr:energy-coupling factor transporter transmembrane protein EcfT [Coriobacteriia bacterium]
LFIRSYERGERVYAAMLSRGFTGTLPSPEPLALGLPDALVIGLVILSSAAIVLY